jgi:hypothetical protein
MEVVKSVKRDSTGYINVVNDTVDNSDDDSNSNNESDI